MACSILSVLFCLLVPVMSQSPTGTRTARRDFSFQQQLDSHFATAVVDKYKSTPTTAREKQLAFDETELRSMELGNAYLAQLSHAIQQATSSHNPSSLDTVPEAVRYIMMGYPPEGVCGKLNFTCNPRSPYRTLDGSCNNLDNPTWGKSFIPLRRFLNPIYDDGMRQPKVRAVNGFLLPNARLVSTIVHASDRARPRSADLTNMVMIWGHQLDLDTSSVPMRTGKDGRVLTCCEEDVPVFLRQILDVRLRDSCFPISMPRRDRRFRRSCLHFARSIQVNNAYCEGVAVEQLNEVTSYIDASPVYTARRTGILGAVSISDTPPSGLSCMNTLLTREHNRLGKALSRVNPHWNDEKLFQEARKILGAVTQKITYSDYLPLILNAVTMRIFKLNSTSYGYHNVYDKLVDASVRNAFSTAASRFVHSILRTFFTVRSPTFAVLKVERLRNILSNPKEMTTPPVDQFLRGLFIDRIGLVDRFITRDATDYHFMTGNDSLDLAALDIQRGRDHGLPGYVAWRKWCGLSDATHFRPTIGGLVDHSPDSAAALEAIYANPNDIDLFTGGISEKPLRGALVGPVFSCMIASQFSLLKKGDRFWFEEKDAYTRFTPEQLIELRKATLSRVLCDNTDTTYIQENAFMAMSTRNSRQPCYSLPRMDLTKWRDFEATPHWSSWSSWTRCMSKTRYQSRRRACLPRRSKCEGSKVQYRSCQQFKI